MSKFLVFVRMVYSFRRKKGFDVGVVEAASILDKAETPGESLAESTSTEVVEKKKRKKVGFRDRKVSQQQDTSLLVFFFLRLSSQLSYSPSTDN